MNNYDAIQALNRVAFVSDCYLHIILDREGTVVTSKYGEASIPIVLDSNQKSLCFENYFVASDWEIYVNERNNASKHSQPSFIVELQRTLSSQGSVEDSKWEFFFITNDFGTCLGIGHTVAQPLPYNMALGALFDSATTDGKEIIDTILEDKLLGFWEFDLEHIEDPFSQGLGQMLGYSQEEQSESNQIHWEKHIHPEDFPDLMKDLQNHFKTTGNLPFKKEFRIIQKTNQTIWALGYGKTTEWSKTKDTAKIVGCIIDISERKKQELWLKEHQYFLKQLAFEQSHILRARVANILGMLEILGSEPQNDEATRLIQLIKKETKLLDRSLKKSIKKSVQKNKLIELDLSGLTKNFFM